MCHSCGVLHNFLDIRTFKGTSDASLHLYTQVFGENREGMVKLEPPSSSRVSDFTHLLSLIPSTSQSSVLSETLSGVEQDNLLMAAQHIRTEEDIQRFLTGEMYGRAKNVYETVPGVNSFDF
jgi:hypothetical protein